MINLRSHLAFHLLLLRPARLLLLCVPWAPDSYLIALLLLLWIRLTRSFLIRVFPSNPRSVKRVEETMFTAVFDSLRCITLYDKRTTTIPNISTIDNENIDHCWIGRFESKEMENGRFCSLLGAYTKSSDLYSIPITVSFPSLQWLAQIVFIVFTSFQYPAPRKLLAWGTLLGNHTLYNRAFDLYARGFYFKFLSCSSHTHNSFFSTNQKIHTLVWFVHFKGGHLRIARRMSKSWLDFLSSGSGNDERNKYTMTMNERERIWANITFSNSSPHFLMMTIYHLFFTVLSFGLFGLFFLLARRFMLVFAKFGSFFTGVCFSTPNWNFVRGFPLVVIGIGTGTRIGSAFFNRCFLWAWSWWDFTMQFKWNTNQK